MHYDNRVCNTHNSFLDSFWLQGVPFKNVKAVKVSCSLLFQQGVPAFMQLLFLFCGAVLSLRWLIILVYYLNLQYSILDNVQGS